TQVRRPRRRSLGLRLELLPSLVEIDLVRPEAQGSPAFRAKHLPRHAEDGLIEVRRTFNRGDRQDKVIEACDAQGLSSANWVDRSEPRGGLSGHRVKSGAQNCGSAKDCNSSRPEFSLHKK